MPDANKLQGCVIISDEKRSYGVVELLAQRVRNQIALTHYTHPHEIDMQRHRFVIVFSVQDLALVVKTFYLKSARMPLLIHIDAPDVINQIDYAVQFPSIDIAPIGQANMTDKEDTLKIALFQEIIEALTSAEGPGASQKPIARQMGTSDSPGSQNAH